MANVPQEEFRSRRRERRSADRDGTRRSRSQAEREGPAEAKPRSKSLVDIGVHAGAFDLMFFRPGLTLGLELKTSDGVISEEQIAFGKAWREIDRLIARWEVSPAGARGELLVEFDFIFKPGRR